MAAGHDSTDRARRPGPSVAADGLEFSLLGPLLVCRGGTRLPVPAGKQRVVLAALLLGGAHLVALEELAEAVWGSFPPASARLTLQNYVNRLRNRLADSGHHRIVTEPAGYRISVGPGDLDIARFEALLRRSREFSRHERWGDAAAVLRQGLELWRGQPLADVPSEWLRLQHGARLTELGSQALEARISADLYLGRHGEVIADLHQVVAADPLREHPQALLMLALYRDGRQAEALRIYRDARRVLAAELAVEPGPELRQLHQQILCADPGLARGVPGPR